MLYPANMQTHGPSRSMEEYLDYLYDEINAACRAKNIARTVDLKARIRAIEDEIEARGSL